MATANLGPMSRLAAYGTLAPGRSNHHQLADLTGWWRPGVVRGEIVQVDGGDSAIYPGLNLDPDGVRVEVQLFESADLPEHWARLDEFEGAAYRRVVTRIETAEGDVEACVYVVADARSA